MIDRVRPDDWNPGVWTHAAVMDMQARLDPVRMAAYADDWQRAVDAARDILVALNRRVAMQLDQSWRGNGADASAAAVRDYVAGSVEGLVASRSVAVQLSELSRAAGDLRACITPPGDGPLDGALAQVRELYSGPAVAAGNAVLDIPAPPQPFALGDQPAGGALPAVTPASSTSPAAVTPSAGVPPDAKPSDGLDYPTALPGLSSAAADPFTATTMPTHSTALSSPSDALPARPEPSATQSPATAGLSSAAPGQAPATAARAVSQPVSPFLGGAYPGYGARDDGAEHRAPRYLVSAGYTNELIGELPLVAPPVIGE